MISRSHTDLKSDLKKHFKLLFHKSFVYSTVDNNGIKNLKNFYRIWQVEEGMDIGICVEKCYGLNSINAFFPGTKVGLE